MSKLKTLIIFSAFTISGSVALVYEVIWQRNLALIFGTTLPATTAVLAAFMGGMAIGSWFFGMLSEKVKDPIKMYGFLEIGVGLYCFFMPVLFQWISQVHVSLFNSMGNSFLLDLLRFSMAVIALALPCSLMGGTLPVLSKGLIQKDSSLGQSLSRLYFLNTIGAASGTVLAGFTLIRCFGMKQTNTLSAILNITLGLIIVLVMSSGQNGLRYPESKTLENKKSSSLLKRSLLPWLYALTGAAAMGAEVAWSRSLNLVLGSTVYAFTLMLASYLFGIAMGSLLIGKRIDKSKNPQLIVGVLSFFIGVSIIFSIALISRLPVVLMQLFPHFHANFYIWQICLFTLALLVVFPATFFLGALFPAFGKAYVSEVKTVGKQVGKLYLLNTFGGITGTLIAGFLLIPTIGTRSSLTVFTVIFLVVAGILLSRSLTDQKSKRQLLVLMILVFAGLGIVPKWEPALMDSGVYVYAPQLVNGFESHRTILFEEEGFHSHVSVSEKNGVKSLRINGKTDGSDGGDLATQVLLSVLPLSHLSNPEKALIVGLGTGVTAGSALNFDSLKVDCVEIDESVVKAAKFFNHVSGDPFRSDRFKLITADARTVLSADLGQYDTIISEPSNPWITGVSNLFTYEYFLSAKNRLKSGGIMCQWIHSYYMDTDTLAVIFSTFSSAFPNCNLWQGSTGDYLILGSSRNLYRDEAQFDFLFQSDALRNDLERINIFTSSDFSARRILTNEEFKSLVNKTKPIINTDDRPYVEFNAPMSLYQDTLKLNSDFISEFID